MSPSMLTFDRFEPGVLIGAHTDAIGERILERWCQLYPWDAPADDRAPQDTCGNSDQ